MTREPKPSAARYTREWGNYGGRMIKLSTNPVISIFRGVGGLIGTFLMLTAFVFLLFGLWPVTLVLGLIGFAFMPRRSLEKQAAIPGAWEGDCPNCSKPIVISDPGLQAVLDPLRSVCPHCRTGVAVSKDRFDVIQ